MKNWKVLIAAFLVLCISVLSPFSVIFAEEDEYYEEYEDYEEYEEEPEEDPIPESYYYEIESNNTPGWPQGPAIESAAATVMDMDSGVFLYSKNATATMYPASITKIMTTLLMVENCNLEDEITFSEIVYDLEEGSSHLGVKPGETFRLKDVAYGIMLASANDMSNGVAEYLGGSLSGFADMMNDKASELGCVNTHFANPHGLYRDDHYTCAYDMALIAKAAYDNPVFREIVSTREYTIPPTNLTEEERSFLNHHKIMHKDEGYYQEWCTGGKTGYTSASLNTLVTYAEKDGKKLVSVVLRVNGADKAYLETTDIMNYGLDNFYTKKIDRNNTDESFYKIMGLEYVGTASEYQSEFWKKQPVADSSILITLPYDASLSDVSCEVLSQNGRKKIVYYSYNGYPVGTSKGTFRPVYGPVQLAFEGEVKVPEGKTVSSTEISTGNTQVDAVLEQIESLFRTMIDRINDYTGDHFLVVLIAGIVILFIVILFIIILIFRSTSEARIKRRRKLEEKERKRREEEIERMTTAEIEAELRAVMEQERVRREQEKLAQANRIEGIHNKPE